MDSMKLEAGMSLAQYRLISMIGAGGMGEVYAAEDTRMGRKVALKVLPLSIANEPSRIARFEQEGRAASALNHPNILTVYDLGRSGEHYFIASELVDGVTLRRQLASGPMKLHDVLDVATQIASALTAAHGEGIVHRDVKPENIMIRRDGYVKVLDFGLAKLVNPDNEGDANAVDGATAHRPTDPGTVLGTVHYMSPEQAQGRSVDARSDIFSVGVVLYEMIAGKVPFEGVTKSHVIVSLVEKNPPSLERIAAVPHELHRIVHKALEKSRDERYQVMKDLLLDLKALRKELEHSDADDREVTPTHQPAMTIAPDRPSSPAIGDSSPPTISSAEYIVSEIRKHKRGVTISVASVLVLLLGIFLAPIFMREAEGGQRLPIAVADFDNRTGDEELNALSGMLITSLEQSKRLAVMTRSRMLDSLKGMGREGVVAIDERIGREICARENVNALVTASIQKFGELYIVDLKVVDTTENEYIFAAKEEGTGKESIPRMIDRLSDRMRVGLKEKQEEVASAKHAVADAMTMNLEAYQHYFRGEELIQHLELDEAVVELRKAVALDPGFFLAHYRLAYALGWDQHPDAKSALGDAFKLIDKAPEKERLMLRAMKAEDGGRLDEAMALWRQVLARYPEEKEAMYQLGDYSYHRGDYRVASESLQKVLAMDPKFTRAHQHLIWTYREMPDAPAMVAAAERFAAVEQSAQSSLGLIDAYTMIGRKADALEASRRAFEAYPSHAGVRSSRPVVLEFYGARDGADRALVQWESEAKTPRERTAVLSLRAALQAHRGRYRAAIATMEEARKIAEAANNVTDAATCAAQKALVTAWSGAPRDQVAGAIASAEGVADKGGIGAIFAMRATYAAAGEYDKARSVLRRQTWSHPGELLLIDGEQEFRAGNFGTAAARFEDAARKGARNAAGQYRLAAARLALGDSQGALAAVNDATGPQHVGLQRDLESWIFVQARSHYLAGKIHEARGDRTAARQSYTTFLEIWKEADPDLAEVADARARMAKL